MPCARCGVRMDPKVGVSLCGECFRDYIDKEIDIWLLVAVDAVLLANENEESVFWDVEFVEGFTDLNVTNAELITHVWRTSNADHIAHL